MQRTALALLAMFALVAPMALAQDSVDVDAGTPGPPAYSGRDRASGAVSIDRGAAFELGNGARLVVPPGGRISRSHVMTFSVGRGNIRPAAVATGFVRVGPAVALDAALDARDAPLELSIRARTDPTRRGTTLVVAMEQPGICDSGHTERIAGPLCSTWTTFPATFENGRLVAHLTSTGGYRFQFGLLPAPTEETGGVRGIP